MTREDKETIAKALSIPSGYASLVLRMKLHPIHESVIDDVFDKSGNKVSFVAANSTGKTSSIITSAIFYAIDMMNAIVVSTSATHRQLTTQLYPNLLKYSALYPHWEFSENRIKINGIPRYIGFATSDSEKYFQGFHSTDESPLLIIVDEAAGVDEGVYKSIGRCKPTYLLICGSPLGSDSVFYSIEREESMKKLFHHYKMTQYDCLKDNGYWLDKKDIEEFVGMWGMENPLVQSSVYANFVDNTEGGLITLGELEKAYTYPPVWSPGSKHVGIDVAAGGDNNCIAYRNGNKVDIIKIWPETDTMKACNQIAEELNKLKEKESITDGQVSLDTDGMGVAFADRLKDLGWIVNRYHANATPENNIQYSSFTAESWLEGIKKIKKCQIILPDNKEFKLQILSRKQVFNIKGKLTLESKKDMKSRGIKSPDAADAVFMSLNEPNAGALTAVHKLNIRPRQYTTFT